MAISTRLFPFLKLLLFEFHLHYGFFVNLDTAQKFYIVMFWTICYFFRKIVSQWMWPWKVSITTRTFIESFQYLSIVLSSYPWNKSITAPLLWNTCAWCIEMNVSSEKKIKETLQSYANSRKICLMYAYICSLNTFLVWKWNQMLCTSQNKTIWTKKIM